MVIIFDKNWSNWSENKKSNYKFVVKTKLNFIEYVLNEGFGSVAKFKEMLGAKPEDISECDSITGWDVEAAMNFKKENVQNLGKCGVVITINSDIPILKSIKRKGNKYDYHYLRKL